MIFFRLKLVFSFSWVSPSLALWELGFSQRSLWIPSCMMWLRVVWERYVHAHMLRKNILFHKFPVKRRLIPTGLHGINILFLKVSLISCFIKQSLSWKLWGESLDIRTRSFTDFEKFNLYNCVLSQKAFPYCTNGEKEMEEDTKNVRITGLNRTQMCHYFETWRDTREETWCMSWRRNMPQRVLHICLEFCLYILLQFLLQQRYRLLAGSNEKLHKLKSGC
jgi:hypothetical protein